MSEGAPQRTNHSPVNSPFSPRNPAPDHSYHLSSPQRKLDQLQGELTERRKLYSTRKQLGRGKAQIRDMKNLIEKLKEKSLLTPEAEFQLKSLGNLPQEILENWNENNKGQLTGRRYSENMQYFASTLHFYSPRACQYPSKLFPLPSTEMVRPSLTEDR